MQARVTHVLCLWLLVPLAVGAAPGGAGEKLVEVEAAEVNGYEGKGLKLTFSQLGPNPALALWTEEEARAVVEALEAEFQETEPKPGPRRQPQTSTEMVRAGLLVGPPEEARRPSVLERRVREKYEAMLGAVREGPPEALEGARWFQALKLSPRYMGEGVREAAEEMFSSRAVLLSVGTSLLLYMLAWAAPEPVFSKAFAAAVTLGLLMTYTATELYNVGQACLRLYSRRKGRGRGRSWRRWPSTSAKR